MDLIVKKSSRSSQEEFFMARSTFHAYPCRLSVMTTENVLDIAAANVAKLIDMSGWSAKEISRRTNGEVSDRSIGLLLSKTHMPGIGKLSAIAEVFGLSAYHLLMKDFDPALFKDGKFDRLFHAYATADDDGRRVMDTTANYVTQRMEAPGNDPKVKPDTKSGTE